MTARYLLFCLLFIATIAQSQTARVQVIHNSPAPTVDVYANEALLLDDFEFRMATPFVDVPAGVQINLGVATADSEDADDAIANFPVTLEDGKSYVVIATGVVGGNPGFDLAIYDMGMEMSGDADEVSVLFYHGSPDAPDVDVVAGGSPLIDDASYGDFQGYLNVPAASYELSVTPADDNDNKLVTYDADLSGLGGGAAVVFASGFFSGDDPAFGAWVALADGTTFALPEAEGNGGGGTARVQVIHNSPDPTVDVYANDDLLLDDFEFRTATPFIDVPAGVEINLGVATADSEEADDAIANFPVTLEDGKSYVVIATGVVGGNPGFDLAIYDMGMEMSGDADEVSVLFYHGSPDAPDVDVVTGGSPLIDDASYGDFQGYLNVPAAAYELSVTPADDNDNILVTYDADLSGLGGGAAVVFASGFFSGDDPAFGAWVALADGTTFALPEAEGNGGGGNPSGTARVQVIHNSPTPTVDVYANDDLLLNDFAFRTATPFIDVPAGVEINLGVATADSDDADDAIANFPVTLEDGKTYVVVATGIVGGNPGFDLAIYDMGMEMANDPSNVGILFYHGAPDAPTVDVLAGGSPIIDDASYGDFQGYLNVPATSYELSVTPGNDNNTIVGTYNADLGFWAGNTAVIFASGFLGGDDPEFEPWVALSNGGTFPLERLDTPDDTPTMARVQVIHNSPTPTVDVYANDDLLLDNFVYRTATPFIDVPAGVEINLGVATADSEDADDAIANFPVILEAGKRYVVIANGIVGGNPGFNLEIFDMGMEKANEKDNVGLLFFHGSPDAPDVDIVAGGNPIFDDVSYGNFQGYLNVPAASYELSVTPANDNNTVVATYQADFSWWAGNTAVVFASGFLNGDPGFVPYVALSNGGTYPLPAISGRAGGDSDRNTYAMINPLGNVTLTPGDWAVFPNPAVEYLNVQANLEAPARVIISLYNLQGQLMQVEDMGIRDGGFNHMNYYLQQNLPAGNYFLQINADNQSFGRQISVMERP